MPWKINFKIPINQKKRKRPKRLYFHHRGNEDYISVYISVSTDWLVYRSVWNTFTKITIMMITTSHVISHLFNSAYNTAILFHTWGNWEAERGIVAYPHNTQLLSCKAVIGTRGTWLPSSCIWLSNLYYSLKIYSLKHPSMPLTISL